MHKCRARLRGPDTLGKVPESVLTTPASGIVQKFSLGSSRLNALHGCVARGRRNECLPYTGLNSDTRHHPEHGTRTMRPGVTEGPHMNLASRLCRTWGPASLCPWERVAGGRASPVLACLRWASKKDRRMLPFF